jgi:hypothetical protein
MTQHHQLLPRAHYAHIVSRQERRCLLSHSTRSSQDRSRVCDRVRRRDDETYTYILTLPRVS